MPTFTAPDGTLLVHHDSGDGPPLVCLPGGPLRASSYLGDLGGLTAHRRLVRLDLRGTGASAVPDDPATYRCDRLVDDVEALRRHLGVERIDLLAHSAGANLAVRYAERHPERIGRLVLVTPSAFALGVEITAEDRLSTAGLRRDELWYPEARAALEAVTGGRAGAADWEAIAPFWYGRWDDAARADHAANDTEKNHEAAAVFMGDGAFEPERTRAALAALTASVLVLAGEFDVAAPPRAMAALAALFPHGEFVVQDGAGHMPWTDDAGRFTATVAEFLSRRAAVPAF
ncbi:alpha/beta hydrolase [Streptomyces sp. Ru71]|uniref:alpha/beta fold hydrolase n=1 Tax=Streptomyces sp. Ru71 TaxID=2080746 RepID=UPI000CDD5D27|nr:alpha/beta hydrolase [Streptomyces sp. Ru71]POX44045.1 alpha/beta hydrolase [Streptomyces sp. Ru71]